MPHFIEYTDGRIEKFEGELNPEALGEDVEAAFTVAKIFTKKAVFKAQDLVPKIVRRIRTATGELKLKEELTSEELAWYMSKRKNEAASRKS
jgi:hypothetical protein